MIKRNAKRSPLKSNIILARNYSIEIVTMSFRHFDNRFDEREKRQFYRGIISDLNLNHLFLQFN